jgi:hypothetical protein
VTRVCAPLLLLLPCALLALVLPARAGTTDPNDDPNTPLPLGPGSPCVAVEDVVPAIAFGFADPNDPNSPNAYSGLRDCASTCKKTGTTCAKYVKRSASCEIRTINDRANFRIKMCAKGDTTCVDGHKTRQATDRAAVETARDAAIAQCNTGAAGCAGACNGAP